jgi:hypothetical protein
MDALRHGRFYASTGVTITSIEVDGLTIRLETENAQRIVALQQTGRRFAQVDDRAITVQVPDDATYVRFECWGAGERFAWSQPFYVEGTADEVAELAFISEWQVSRLLEHGTLETASPEEGTALPGTPLAAYPAVHASPGFASVRDLTEGNPGLVYLRAEVHSDRETRGVLKLGFDGPVRAWVNGREVFAGPGANPARPDMVAVYADFHPGANQVLVALDTNGGKAWGIFGKVEL